MVNFLKKLLGNLDPKLLTFIASSYIDLAITHHYKLFPSNLKDYLKLTDCFSTFSKNVKLKNHNIALKKFHFEIEMKTNEIIRNNK